ncbi:hypothetical protein BU16DRAFT_549018 [Lophium mytilinum]|uniref:Zn(2)-C6 fungal-type domain-containing protein n=1 Tax=Lophium mytilinum TaxID=390894 RepID=A0A6A6QXI0_9PEZI|nr:hypothetical protein BU16DRAFT_549018 [Lophium mytilinum]
MVNYGASRACATCKQRRKKCDESRPNCQRCIKAGRVCLGYQENSGVLFRNYGPPALSEVPSITIQRPMSPPGAVIPEPNDERLEKDALEMFFDGYCVELADRTISRGFLDGLKPLIDHAGESSDIAQAAKIVALATTGNKLRRPQILYRTKQQYGDLLQSFRSRLMRAAESDLVEVLITAILLGLYEIVSSTESDPSQHNAHVSGVGAILSKKDSPFDLSTGTRLFQLGNAFLLQDSLPQPKHVGLLCAPSRNRSVLALDSVLIKVNPIFNLANDLFAAPSCQLEEVRTLRQEAIDLERHISTWPTKLTKEWEPRVVGNISEAQLNSSKSPGWPGDVNSYFDLYVAAVWNTYRKTHLMILDIIVKCSNYLEPSDVCFELHPKAQQLADDIAASIPYHLTNDVSEYVQRAQTGGEAKYDGRPVGGLLLLHPLWVVANASIVSHELCTHMRKELSWIGHGMGIGQANQLASPWTTLSSQHIAQGHVLIWAGMLTQPI